MFKQKKQGTMHSGRLKQRLYDPLTIKMSPIIKTFEKLKNKAIPTILVSTGICFPQTGARWKSGTSSFTSLASLIPFSPSQVQVKHHYISLSCLPNCFWQPGVRNFSWDSVNKPGFMLEMHKCTLSSMVSTLCWCWLSLQIEMQVSLRHFLCSSSFPGIAQSQLLQKISRLARRASTGPPPARGARAGHGRVGTSTVWSLFDCPHTYNFSSLSWHTSNEVPSCM